MRASTIDVDKRTRCATLNGTSTRVGFPLRNREVFTLRINPDPRGNSPGTSKKPATESTRAQGPPECSNPSRVDLKPPLRLEQADNEELDAGKSPLVYRRVWHNPFRK